MISVDLLIIINKIMKRLYFNFILLFSVNILSGQQASSLRVDLSQRDSLIWEQVEIQKGAQLDIDFLPSKLFIELPEDNILSFKMQINKDSLVYIIGFNCDVDSSCIKLNLSDISNNSILLRFLNNELIGIGNRFLDKPIKILLKGNKPYFKFLSDDSNSTQNNIKKQQTVHFKNICDSTFIDQEQLILDKDWDHFSYLCATSSTKGSSLNTHCCNEATKNKYDYSFLPPCYNPKGKALSTRYHIFYDFNSRPETITYLKLAQRRKSCEEDGDKVEFYKVKKGPLHPKAMSEIMVSILGERDSSYVLTTNSTQNFMDDEDTFSNALSNVVKTDSAQKTDGETTDGIALTAVDTAIVIKRNFIDLRNDLNQFNSTFISIDNIEYVYLQDLICLQKRIANKLSIPIPVNGNELVNVLALKLNQANVPEKFYLDLCMLLTEIGTAYDEAISKKTKHKITSSVVQVTNTDQFTISVNTKKKTPVFERTFDVSGGFKIDFSTGFFLTGHSAGDFVVSNELFRYKETRDTISPDGSISSVYTGKIIDTTMNVIRQNSNLTFGTGAYMHFYPRTGQFFDLGGSVGIIIDNTASIQILLGGSVMFKTGKNRVAIVGGLALGKERSLSIENEQYYLSDKVDFYDNIKDLPSNFTGTNIATYDKWANSWFVGLTFNLASKTSNE